MITINGGRLETSCKIEASAERVWQIITDTTLWPVWGPSVIDVSCSERYISANSSGHVKTALGFWLPFKVTQYTHAVYWGWCIGSVPATGHRIDPVNGHCCRLVFDMAWYAFPYVTVCFFALRKIRQLIEDGRGCDSC